MKNLFTVLALAAAVSFISCGPSQADIDKRNKQIQDSTDSANKVASDAEAAKMEAEQHMKDSLDNVMKMHVADSLHQDSVKRKLIKKAK